MVFIFSALTGLGQQINMAEYFIDSDPGFGLGTSISVASPGDDLTLNFNVNTSILSEGFHAMVVRARDDLGRWSLSHQHIFYIFEYQNAADVEIDKAEYFIDNDPGQGLGIDIPVTQGNLVDIPIVISTTTPVLLTEGFHTVGIRARNTNGDWGFYPEFMRASDPSLVFFEEGAAVAGKNIESLHPLGCFAPAGP